MRVLRALIDAGAEKRYATRAGLTVKDRKY